MINKLKVGVEEKDDNTINFDCVALTIILEGLEKIHALTKMETCRLRVDLWSFDDEHAFAEYR